jgi:hypothetical protein
MLAARFTKSHSSLDFWSFLSMSGHTRDIDEFWADCQSLLTVNSCFIDGCRYKQKFDAPESKVQKCCR